MFIIAKNIDLLTNTLIYMFILEKKTTNKYIDLHVYSRKKKKYIDLHVYSSKKIQKYIDLEKQKYINLHVYYSKKKLINTLIYMFILANTKKLINTLAYMQKKYKNLF